MFVSMRCHQNLVKNFVRWKFKVFSHAAFLSLPFKPGFPIYEEGKALTLVTPALSGNFPQVF